MALSRFRPHTLVPANELLPLAEFTSKHEFLHQAQRRFTTVVHNRNWRDLAVEFAKEGSEGSRSAPRGKKGKARAEGRERARHAAWREVWRSASWRCLSQDGAGAFLNTIPTVCVPSTPVVAHCLHASNHPSPSFPLFSSLSHAPFLQPHP